MKDQRYDYLEKQKIELKENEEEVKRLKAKWFKLSSTMKFTDFLEHVCQEKKKLIINLEKFWEQQKNKNGK